MARRYDTTFLSPDPGRLFQVEYAIEAIGHAGTCLGILANDGILLAAERRNTNKLLEEVFFSEKIYKSNEDMVCSVAGITSDANVLTNELRVIAQRYLLNYGESIPCEQLVSWLCDLKQAYTQYGGKGPFGVTILYMGRDKQHGYQCDPSGNYSGWKATCIGNSSAAAVSILKQEYKEGTTTLQDAKSLSIKVLSKTLDMTKLNAEKLEMATLVCEYSQTRILPAKDVEAIISNFEKTEDIEVIGHAGTCLGILANDGILLAAERRNTNKLLDEVFFSEKIYKINEDMVCSVAGITSDANVLTNELRVIAQRYLLNYGESIPCEQMVSWLCDLKQAYTQYGGKGPFGVSILYMGWDKQHGYQCDPSGNYSGWKATCVGNYSAAAVSILKQEYKEGTTTLQDAKSLSIKVLSKTLDMTKLNAEKLEMATLVCEYSQTRILPAKDVEAIISNFEKTEDIEVIGHAGTCLGILANDGILLAAERRNTNKLLDEVFFSEKIYKINEDMVCSVAGITSDANDEKTEVEMATLVREDGQTRIRILPAKDVEAIMEKTEGCELLLEAFGHPCNFLATLNYEDVMTTCNIQDHVPAVDAVEGFKMTDTRLASNCQEDVWDECHPLELLLASSKEDSIIYSLSFQLASQSFILHIPGYMLVSQVQELIKSQYGLKESVLMKLYHKYKWLRPASSIESHNLQQGDNIELVIPLQGGGKKKSVKFCGIRTQDVTKFHRIRNGERVRNIPTKSLKHFLACNWHLVSNKPIRTKGFSDEELYEQVDVFFSIYDKKPTSPNPEASTSTSSTATDTDPLQDRPPASWAGGRTALTHTITSGTSEGGPLQDRPPASWAGGRTALTHTITSGTSEGGPLQDRPPASWAGGRTALTHTITSGTSEGGPLQDRPPASWAGGRTALTHTITSGTSEGGPLQDRPPASWAGGRTALTHTITSGTSEGGPLQDRPPASWAGGRTALTHTITSGTSEGGPLQDRPPASWAGGRTALTHTITSGTSEGGPLQDRPPASWAGGRTALTHTITSGTSEGGPLQDRPPASWAGGRTALTHTITSGTSEGGPLQDRPPASWAGGRTALTHTITSGTSEGGPLQDRPPASWAGGRTALTHTITSGSYELQQPSEDSTEEELNCPYCNMKNCVDSLPDNLEQLSSESQATIQRLILEDTQQAIANYLEQHSFPVQTSHCRALLIQQATYVLRQNDISSKLRGQLEELRDEKLCVVCLAADRNMCFHHCRHVCCCEECAHLLMAGTKRCPLCTAPVQNVHPVFLS